MAFKIVDTDNVRESFATSGTTITLGGAMANSRAFSAVLADGDTFLGVARKGAEVSIGIFTYTASGGTVAQTTVWYSTNSNTAVSFSTGTTGEIFIDAPSRLFDELNLAAITVSSAATADIGAVQGGKILISGTVTITSLGTSANKRRFVKFTGALTLTHNATTLILPVSRNIVTANGDTAVFVSDASGNWTCWSYQFAGTLNNSFTATNFIASQATVATAWLFDGTANKVTLANNGTQVLPAGSGLVVLRDSNVTGHNALYLTGGGVVNLVSTTSALFVSGVPGANFIGLSASGSTYTITNKSGGSVDIAVLDLRVGTA